VTQNAKSSSITPHWLEDQSQTIHSLYQSRLLPGLRCLREMARPLAWVDMLYLLFLRRSTVAGARALLETLAIALANPGQTAVFGRIRVHAAMCGGCRWLYRRNRV